MSELTLARRSAFGTAADDGRWQKPARAAVRVGRSVGREQECIPRVHNEESPTVHSATEPNYRVTKSRRPVVDEPHAVKGQVTMWRAMANPNDVMEDRNIAGL